MLLMRTIQVLLLLSISYMVNAQLTITINSVPDYTPIDAEIYLAGDISSWNPSDPDYKLDKISDTVWQIVLPEMDHGRVIAFKFTRGSWETVEKGANGEEIGDRHYTFGNGGAINPVILNWADNGGGGGGSTASANVSIMDDSFYMPQFDRNRRIWIYLPPNYETSEISYPVLYMHDGQNLFDTQTSYAGEWEVDETLDNLYDLGYNVPIVIGVDNGGSNRIDEYTPWVNSEYGGGDGELYIDFMVETLKPFVDENYRTLSDRENTAIMGSSLGGLISHYGIVKHQDIFSKAGLYSPSYWFSDSVWTFTSSNSKQYDCLIYQMCGDGEGYATVHDMETMDTYFRDLGFTSDELFIKVVEGGEHNERLWREDFEECYKWLFKDYLGTVELNEVDAFMITPNPARDNIKLTMNIEGYNDSIDILDIQGNLVLKSQLQKDGVINIESLKPGKYVVRINGNNKTFTSKFIKY